MRRLTWMPTAVNIKMVRINPQIEKITDLDGKTRKVERGGEMRPMHDRADCQTLKIKESDFKFFVPAIQWILGSQHCFCFTVPERLTPDAEGHLLIDLPGMLTPDLSPADVTEICADWKLLGKRFPIYTDIFKTTGDKMLWDLILILLEANRQNLPEWASRILHLKTGAKDPAGGDSGWENG